MEQLHPHRHMDAASTQAHIGWLASDNAVPDHLVQLLSALGLSPSATRIDDVPASRLVIIDCAHFSGQQIHEYLVMLQQQDCHPDIALYQPANGSTHEQLINWPNVRGIFYADCSADHLLKGIAALLAGQNWLPRRILDEWLNRQRNRLPPPAPVSDVPELTERERQILRLIDRASTNAQIAYALSISEHTVKTHLYNIFRKISVRNRTQASNWVKANIRQVEA